MLQRVRHWRATEVYLEQEPVAAFHSREMAWCASSQLKLFGECRFRFSYGVFPRCALCPLLEVERAVRDMLGENPLPPLMIEIQYGPRLRALLRGERDELDQEFAEDWRVPEFLRGCVAVCCLEQDFPIEFHTPIIPCEVLLCGTCLVASTEVIRKLPAYGRLPHGYGCVAIEDVNDIIADLEQALAAI